MRALLLLSLFSLTACFSPFKTNVQRTALDQQLSSAALRACVEGLELSEIPRRHRYAVEVSAPTDADVQLAASLVQERLFREGFQLRRQGERGDARVELVVHYAGTDIESTLWGIPLFIPGLPVGASSISLYRSSKQIGRASVELMAWGPGGELLELTPPVRQRRTYWNFSFLTFIGDFRWTDIEDFDG